MYTQEAERDNANTALMSKVTSKSMQDRYKKLQDRFEKIDIIERRTSSIGGEVRELENLIIIMSKAVKYKNKEGEENLRRSSRVKQ